MYMYTYIGVHVHVHVLHPHFHTENSTEIGDGKLHSSRWYLYIYNVYMYNTSISTNKDI